MTEFIINDKIYKIHFSGYFFACNELVNNDKKLISFLINSDIKKLGIISLINYFSLLSGSWTIILESEDQVIAAVDRVRSRPLYYKKINKKIIVSNLIQDIRLKNIFKTNQISIKYYKKNKISPPGKTLDNNIMVIRPGSYIYFKNGCLFENQYYETPVPFCNEINPSIESSKATLLKSLENLYFYLKKFPSKNIYIPLSGGMDSRLIAAFLSKKEDLRKRIYLYTYGNNKYNEDTKISKAVAKELKLNWVFVEYSRKMWKDLRTNFINDVMDHFPYEFCVPNLQEYFSVDYLTNSFGKGIFLPGYFLDLPAGCYICPDELSLISKFFRGYSKEFRTNSKVQDWYRDFIENRLSYVLRSCEWFQNKGCDFYLPYIDNNILDYWFSINAHNKKERIHFKEVIRSIYHELNPELNNIKYTENFFKYGLVRNEVYGLKSIVKQFISKNNLEFVLNIFKSKKRIYDYLGVYNITFKNEFEHSESHYNDIVKSIVLSKINKK